MKQRLCIGIHQLTRNWRLMLDQLGLWYEEVDYSDELSGQYSTVILNKKPESSQENRLNSYLNDGGSILEITGVHQFTDSKKTTRKKVKGLINNSDDPAFLHIPFIDLYAAAELYKDSALFNGLLHFEKFAKGNIGFLGVNLPDLLQQTGYTRKRFYSDIGPFPDEIVSKVSKKQLSDLLDAALKELHFQRNIPYIQKWISPTEKPVFGFRVDSDFGNKESIDRLYQVLDKHKIPGTWFLHVHAHEQWLNYFHTFNNQEIALHGFKHGTSKSIPKMQENIRMGKYLLEEADFSPKGFCAPYGIWNKALYRSLKAFDFSYTSEFTFTHDGLPVYHQDTDIPLQIPVHPICTGSLNRKHYTADQMSSYFLHKLEQKIGRFEPAFFYHHPLQPGLDAINTLFQEVKRLKLNMVTFTEFAEFWESRRKTRFEAFNEGDIIGINSDQHSEIRLQISRDHQHFYLLKNHTGESRISDKQKFEYSNCYLPSIDDAEYMNRKDLRMIKTSLFDWKNRNRL